MDNIRGSGIPTFIQGSGLLMAAGREGHAYKKPDYRMFLEAKNT